MGTAIGFAIALLTLGAVREILGQGTLMADMDMLFGPAAASMHIDVFSTPPLSLALLPPGAFLIAGLLFALVQGLNNRTRVAKDEPDATVTTERS
jgi:electron transport complex protein RnfE